MDGFRQFTNGKDLYIGVDFGYGKDLAVETVIRKQADGSCKIVSSNIIGRSADFTKERKEQICKRYEELCNKDTVEQKPT